MLVRTLKWALCFWVLLLLLLTINNAAQYTGACDSDGHAMAIPLSRYSCSRLQFLFDASRSAVAGEFIMVAVLSAILLAFLAPLLGAILEVAVKALKKN